MPVLKFNRSKRGTSKEKLTEELDSESCTELRTLLSTLKNLDNNLLDLTKNV